MGLILNVISPPTFSLGLLLPLDMGYPLVEFNILLPTASSAVCSNFRVLVGEDDASLYSAHLGLQDGIKA